MAAPQEKNLVSQETLSGILQAPITYARAATCKDIKFSNSRYLIRVYGGGASEIPLANAFSLEYEKPRCIYVYDPHFL